MKKFFQKTDIKGGCSFKYGIYKGVRASACMLFSQGGTVREFVRATSKAPHPPSTTLVLAALLERPTSDMELKVKTLRGFGKSSVASFASTITTNHKVLTNKLHR